jgi:hypothetical protein
VSVNRGLAVSQVAEGELWLHQVSLAEVHEMTAAVGVRRRIAKRVIFQGRRGGISPRQHFSLSCRPSEGSFKTVPPSARAQPVHRGRVKFHARAAGALTCSWDKSRMI